jgi:putative acetyltransferase
MHLHVRPARADDRERLLDLWERSVRATHHFLSESDIVMLRPFVAEELASGTLDWWIAESDGEKPVGFLGYAPDTIEGLFIDPDYYGLGAGTHLIAHAQSLSGGILAVDVNEQNEDARRFYESRGFSVVGRSPTDTAGRPFPLLHMKRAVSGPPSSGVRTMREGRTGRG